MDLVNVKTVVSTGTRIQPKTNGQRKRSLGSYHIYFPYSSSGCSPLSCSQFALPEGSAYRRQILLKNVLSYLKASPLHVRHKPNPLLRPKIIVSQPIS